LPSGSRRIASRAPERAIPLGPAHGHALQPSTVSTNTAVTRLPGNMPIRPARVERATPAIWPAGYPDYSQPPPIVPPYVPTPVRVARSRRVYLVATIAAWLFVALGLASGMLGALFYAAEDPPAAMSTQLSEPIVVAAQAVAAASTAAAALAFRAAARRRPQTEIRASRAPAQPR
jgi:hypothetical protein